MKAEKRLMRAMQSYAARMCGSERNGRLRKLLMLAGESEDGMEDAYYYSFTWEEKYQSDATRMIFRAYSIMDKIAAFGLDGIAGAEYRQVMKELGAE